MTSSAPATTQTPLSPGPADGCEACGASPDPAVLLAIPVPVAVLANLGLPTGLPGSTRLLCTACAEKGLQGKKLDLADLVRMAPEATKQGIYASLAHEYEI